MARRFGLTTFPGAKREMSFMRSGMKNRKKKGVESWAREGVKLVRQPR